MRQEGFKKGFTMVELTLVLVLVGVIVTIGMLAFNKLYAPTVAGNEYSKTMQVIGAVERAAGDNGGRFPAEGGAEINIDATSVVKAQMGGNTGDLSGWTYICSGTSATIKTAELSSTTVATLLTQKIIGSSPSWSAVNNGDKTVSITKSNVTCN